MPDLSKCAKAIDNLYGEMLKQVLDRPEYDELDIYTAQINKVADLDTNIWIGKSTIGNIQKQDFMNRIFKVTQSKQEFLLSGELELEIIVTKHLAGKGNRSVITKAPQNVNEIRSKMQSLIQIKNNDNSCGYRAIFIGIMFYVLKLEEKGAKHKDVRYKWEKTIGSKFPDYQTDETKSYAKMLELI